MINKKIKNKQGIRNQGDKESNGPSLYSNNFQSKRKSEVGEN